MGDATAEYRRLETAYDQPTLALLSKTTAISILTCFRLQFSTQKPTVPTIRMHDQVAAHLGELRASGMANVPSGDGAAVCKKWVTDGWLIRSADDDGNEVYSLTSHALDAINTVERLTKDRSISLSSHLISGFLHHLRTFASALNPDVSTRIATIDAQILELEAERERLENGGTIRELTEDEVISGFEELQRFITDLPRDFQRVVEDFKDFQTTTIDQFRRDKVTSGDAIAAYLEYDQNLATATAAGRGFEGAVQLLLDEGMLDDVRAALEALLGSDRARALLLPEERRETRNVVTLLREGISAVNVQRSKVSRTLHDYVSSHNVEHDAELAATLRGLEAAAHAWMETARPRDKAPVELLPGQIEVRHLRTKMRDPADDQPPEPLVLTPERDDRRPARSLAELRARGGPSHAALRDHLADRLAGGDISSLAEEFHALPSDLRRPVEVFAMIPLARRQGLVAVGDVETYQTVRPDGTIRLLAVPHYASPDTGTGAASTDPPAAGPSAAGQASYPLPQEQP